jgi:dihydroxyacetone kinase-like protein
MTATPTTAPELVKKLVTSVANKVIASADELTSLDQAIGDGDHGLNMQRGFEAVLAQLNELVGMTLPEATTAIGFTLVMSVGGASGPLFGTLFRVMGKALPAQPTTADVARALNEGIDAVKRLGRSDVGQKTMLDVLIPVQEEIATRGSQVLSRVRSRSRKAAAATIPMQAIKGRASFLGERSIGHMDPGARSCEIIIEVVCDVLEEEHV